MKGTMARHNNLTQTQTLGFLLKSHYLAEEFPGVVTTSNFATYCVNKHASLETVKALLGRTTLYGTFSAPRAVGTRRVLALPHPTSQLALSRIIAENRDTIAAIIDSSKITLYKTSSKIKESRAFVGLDFRSRAKAEARILARSPVILKADIANFFHTIYSHSLPWAVLGKQDVKNTREGKDKSAKDELKNHWSSKIDEAIQSGNSRETFGIPVGPDTSRIIAEILLAGIHKEEPFAKLMVGRDAYRLVDDFFIGFDDESAARRCHDALRRVLWDYNLHLNETKTKITPASQVFENGWKFDIENFRITDTSPSKQHVAVGRLLDITLRHCESEQDWRPASFFCRRLLSIDIDPSNFSFVRDCILRVGRDFTMCLKFVTQFVTNYRDSLADDESRRIIEQWAKHILATHAKRGHDFEVSSILVICGVLGIKVDQAFIALDEKIVSPVVLSIIGLLSADQLLIGQWDEWRTPPAGTGSIANGRNWLPHYEAVLRKWTKDPEILREIKSDPLFSQLLKSKVTFLDDSDFLSKTVKPSPAPMPSSGRKKPLAIARSPARSERAMFSESYDQE
jgi:hypothetical protein